MFKEVVNKIIFILPLKLIVESKDYLLLRRNFNPLNFKFNGKEDDCKQQNHCS